MSANLQTPPNSTGAIIDSNLLGGTNVRIIESIGSPTVLGNVAEVDSGKSLQVTTQPQTTWSVTSAPTTATQATATKAAGGGTVKHVATSLAFSAAVDGSNAQTRIQVNLRDGATGAGTILWQVQVLMVATAASQYFGISGLKLIGTANTAMTLEFSAAGVTGSLQAVSLTGYDLPS